ncbi:MAG: O-antigen ligase family protein [Thermosipho sp. (in: Bacteria)]|nr:O-antigen ligase family protein [Thermosipho sp. (in: thermotogales)]
MLKINKILLFLGVFFVFLESTKFIPGSFNVKPLSDIFFVLLFLKLIVEKNTLKFDKYFFTFIFLTFIYSFAILNRFSIERLFSYIVGFVIYSTLRNINKVELVKKAIYWSIYINIIVGFFQLLYILTKNSFFRLGFIIKEIISSGAPGGFRIILLDFEPSWAGRYLVFSLIFVIFDTKKFKHKNLLIIFLSLLLFFTLSLSAFLILLISIIIYTLFYRRKLKYYKKYINYLIIFLIILLAIYIPLQTNPYINWMVNRIYNLFYYGINPKYDGSVFTRFSVPYTGLYLFSKNPIFGIGIGQFPIKFHKYYTSLFGFNVSGEMKYVIRFDLPYDPKSFFITILSEGGLITFSFYLIFLYKLYIKTRKSNELSKAMFSYSISISFFGYSAFLPILWIALYLASTNSDS